jgi:hypothetical protein
VVAGPRPTHLVPRTHALDPIHQHALTSLISAPYAAHAGKGLAIDLRFNHGQLITQLFQQFPTEMLALGLLPLGCLGDDLQLAEVAHYTLLNCERHARYSAMLLSDRGQFLPKKTSNQLFEPDFSVDDYKL